MRLRRLLGVTLLVATSSMSLVGTAVAGSYAPHTGAAKVSKTRVVQGDSVVVSGDRFCRNAAVRVTVTQGGDTYISKTIRANGSGVASTSVKLTELGINHLQLSGCYAGGGKQTTQKLSATVRVVPHRGSLHASDHEVNKGDRVDVWSWGLCKNTEVKVRVYDDGDLYQAKAIHADGHGKAETSVTLTRAGRTTITFQGCRKPGGVVLKSTTVKVSKNHSFRSSPAAYVGDIAGSVQPAAYAAGGGLILLFGGAQLLIARRRRSS